MSNISLEGQLSDLRTIKVVSDLLDGEVEYRHLSKGSWRDKVRYIERSRLKVIGVIIDVHTR